MDGLELRELHGTNPLGFFAALGALDVVARALPGVRPTLAWTDALEPTAVINGPDDLDHLVRLCDADRTRWAESPVLAWGPDGHPLDDLKPPLTPYCRAGSTPCSRCRHPPTEPMLV